MSNKLIIVFSLTLVLALAQLKLDLPRKIYLKDDYLFINTQSNKSLLSPAVIEALRLKIPITITYYIDFYEKFLFFFDKKIVNLKIVRVIDYDIWSREYFVHSDSAIKKIGNITQLKNNINYLRDIQLLPISAIKPDKKYFFRSRVSLQKKNLSIYFHLIDNILSVLNFETAYYESSLYFGDELLNILSK